MERPHEGDGAKLKRRQAKAEGSVELAAAKRLVRAEEPRLPMATERLKLTLFQLNAPFRQHKQC